MKTNVRNILRDIDGMLNMLSESYVFDRDEQHGFQREESPYPGEEDEEGFEQEQPQAGNDDRIIQMRELALQGLQDYANDVDNPLYDFYKKVWLETDKLCEHKDGHEG